MNISDKFQYSIDDDIAIFNIDPSLL